MFRYAKKTSYKTFSNIMKISTEFHLRKEYENHMSKPSHKNKDLQYSVVPNEPLCEDLELMDSSFYLLKGKWI